MRVVARVFVFLIALGLLLGPALYLARDSLAPLAVSWFARVQLGIGDLGDPRFRVTSLSRDGVTLEALALADGRIAADTVRASFDLAELFSGRLRALEIRGLTLRARLQNGRLAAGPIEMPATSAPDQAPAAPDPGRIPFDRLILDDVRVVVMTETDIVELAGNIEAGRGAGGTLDWSGDLSASLSSALLGGGKADGDLSVDGSMSADGDITVTLDLRRGGARFRDLSLAAARGGIRARVPFGAQPTIRAALAFDEVAARGIVIPRLSLDAHGRGRSGTISAVIGDPSTRAGAYTFVGDIRHDDSGRAKFAFSGGGALAVLHDLLGQALGSPLDRIEGSLDLNGEFGVQEGLQALVADPATVLSRAVGNGAATIEISSIKVGDDAHDLSIQTSVTAIVAPGLMEIRLAQGSRAMIPKSWVRSLTRGAPQAIRPWFEDRISVEFGFDEEPLAVLASLGGEAPELHFSGGVRAILGTGGRVTLDGQVTGRPASADDGWWNIAFKDLTLRASDLDVRGHRIKRGELIVDGSAGPHGARGTFSVKGDGAFDDAMPLGGVDISLGGALASAGHETHITLERAGISLRPRAGEAGGFTLLEPVEIAQPPETSTTIIVSHASDDPLPRSVKTAWRVGAVRVGQPGGDLAKVVRLDIGRLDASFTSAVGGADGRITLGLDAARVGYAGLPVRLSNLAVNAGFKGGDVLEGLRFIDASIAEVAQTVNPAWIAPLKITMSGKRRGAAARMDLQGAVSGATPGFTIPFTGEVRLSDGAGRIAIDQNWLSFGPETLTVGAISPALATHVETATGRIGLSGHIAWPAADRPDAQRLSIEVEALSIGAAAASVEQATGGITFSNFMPPRSDGVGRLAMEMLNVGVPIPRARMEVAIDGLDGAVLRNASGGFAGGRIFASDVKLAFKEPTTMTIQAEGVDAAAITSMLKVRGLDAEGSLSGVLPVTWTPDLGLSIVDARLSADGPGTVRYKAGEKDQALRQSGEQVGLMLDALSDFRFKTLEMGIAGSPGAGFHVELALEGANPNLYDGYPVRFNLDLAGQLDDIIKTGYRTYTLPDRVRDAVLRGEAND